ncbi:TonB-dependent receptor plug domain-containing protein [Alteriqipengyuania flavescens]|uniref:TonB-dependent receptor plug domain-containing protein n=1 Tax=Alteriqipengyuania flavescens TaxID=3053610 RepID=UPI0025B3EEDB|nr:TonB-dependent receptor plug domain-containing protein [Alteriqipengyuania flavescens]WJY18911.1 TonB-dependent receptor plug domain-containing protein [Alteriqipengyuania flavescens]WJY24851.1 TonB-dependent receptor plug domain-containing protein [Alteriqipengyuania flavescens]
MTFWTPSLGAIAVSLFALPAVAAAQDAPSPVAQDVDAPDTEAPVEGDEILVIGRSLRGQINAPEAPIIELDEADIAAYGASSIADLVQQLSPQTSSARGRGGGQPVFLVNGLRVSSFREFRSYPPEAIEKVEVLPEEVAQRYGFPPDRRVINFIMKENYSSREIEVEVEGPTRGGFAAGETELTYLKLADQSRLNLNAEYNQSSLLTESERGIAQVEDPALPAGVDQGLYRSLRGESRSLELTGNHTTRLGEGITTLSSNATYERSESRSLSGVRLVEADGTVDPLDRRTRSDTLSYGGALNTLLGDWDTALTMDISRAESESDIDLRFDADEPLAPAVANSRTQSTGLASKATFRGTPLVLPAGEVSTTFDLGGDWTRVESQDSRTARDTDLSRRNLNAGVNVTIPIAERDYAWGALGDLALNLSAGVEDVSDFGTLGDYNAGLTWGIFENLTLGASYTYAEQAPGLTQLGAAQVDTFNVPVYDFANNTTSLVTVTSGGNPDLLAETQRDWKFSANWQPWFWDDARLNVEYFDNSSRNVTASFPFLTPEIEAAFPGRVQRNAFGELVALDSRPVTYARQDASRLAVGLTVRGSFGEARPQGGQPEGAGGRPAAAGEGSDRPEGARPGGGPGGAGGPPGMSEEQRVRFMEFRTKVCAEDGMDFIRRVVAAVDGDEAAIAEMGEGFDPQQAAGFLARFRKDDGTVDFERVAQFRTMICSRETGGGQQASGAGQGGGQRGGGGGGRRGGGMFGGGDGRGRYFVNLTYNYELTNEILIAEGGPLLDLLDGDAVDSSGNPRGSASLEAGAFRDGLGLRLSGRYSGASTVLGTGAPGSTDLFFGDLATFDVRLFADLGEVIDNEGIWKGARVSLRADNIFDTRRRVTDGNGDVPIAYQPFLVDPVGSYVGIEFRKLFF